VLENKLDGGATAAPQAHAALGWMVTRSDSERNDMRGGVGTPVASFTLLAADVVATILEAASNGFEP
jgi:hypothetical protein